MHLTKTEVKDFRLEGGAMPPAFSLAAALYRLTKLLRISTVSYAQKTITLKTPYNQCFKIIDEWFAGWFGKSEFTISQVTF